MKRFIVIGLVTALMAVFVLPASIVSAIDHEKVAGTFRVTDTLEYIVNDTKIVGNGSIILQDLSITQEFTWEGDIAGIAILNASVIQMQNNYGKFLYTQNANIEMAFTGTILGHYGTADIVGISIVKSTDGQAGTLKGQLMLIGTGDDLLGFTGNIILDDDSLEDEVLSWYGLIGQ